MAPAAKEEQEQELTTAMQDLELSPPPAAPQISFEDFLAEGAPTIFFCPISLCLLRDPVVAMDSHTYEKSSIVDWIEKCKAKGNPLTSPSTGCDMEPGFVPNQYAKSQVLEWIDKRTKEWQQRQTAGRREGGKGKRDDV